MGAIERWGLRHAFSITQRSITSWCGSEFIFDGLHANVDQIKSKENIDICWDEEAHSTTAESLKFLIPTIRNDPPAGPFGTGSEIWFSLNQHDDTDAVYSQFIAKQRPGSIVVPVTWEDNPFFPGVLDEERRYMLADDPDAYDWVWGLDCRRIGSSIIFKGRFIVEEFDSPTDDELRGDVRFYHGMDFGFANDPSFLIRSFIRGNDLYIDQEAVGYGVEFEELPALMDTIETARAWPIKADSSRPETISYLKRKGYLIEPAEKWDGSVEDGIAHLKGFRKIHIHQRCKHMAREARLYAYKVDRVSGDVLPIVVDKHNHGWDGLRYSLDKFIQRRGGLSMWERLGQT